MIPDPPVPGAIDWLREVAADYEIVILTTRGRTREGCEAVGRYLAEHGFRGEFRVTDVKPPALIYVDDRAWRFRGRFPTLRQIRYAVPWRVTDGVPTLLVEKFAERGRTIDELGRKQQGLKGRVGAYRRTLAELAEQAAALRANWADEGDWPELAALLDLIAALAEKEATPA